MPMGMFWKRKYHGRMHVITRKRLNEFAEKFPKTKSALAQPTELANLQCLTLEETESV
jgi:hypothetical protein